MIRNPSIVQSFENALIRQEPVNYRRNLRIFEALFSEARALGVIPLTDPLDGIDVDIRIAGVLNARGVAPAHRDRS
jgi:hypothetical protein